MRQRTIGPAFTLIELLLVIAMIGILASLLFPALGKAKEAARSTACLGHLRQIGISLQLYTDENNNRLPVMRDKPSDTNSVPGPRLPSIDELLAPQLGNPQVLRCPSDRTNLFERTGSSYSWNSLLNGQDAGKLSALGLQFDPHQIPLVFDKEGFHRARGKGKEMNYLYADGHIKNLLVIEGTLQK